MAFKIAVSNVKVIRDQGNLKVNFDFCILLFTHISLAVSWIVMKLIRWVGLTLAFNIIGTRSRSSQGQGHSEVNISENSCCYHASTVSWIVMKLGRWVDISMAIKIIGKRSRSF